MIVVLSPAKSLDYETPLPTEKFTHPILTNKTEELIGILRHYSTGELAQLMSVSDKLAQLNFQRYQDWQPEFTPENSRQALFAFNGDVYEGLQAYSMTTKNIQYAQAHLRILSGLYGVLRPLDLMQPYRLEMGTKLKNPEGKNLYEFWRNAVVSTLNQDLKKRNDVLVNLASDEYFKSIHENGLNAKVVQPIFQDYKNNTYKIISFYAKKARGLMARYIVDHEVSNAEALKNFDVAGYRFSPDSSTDDKWVFRRQEAG